MKGVSGRRAAAQAQAQDDMPFSIACVHAQHQLGVALKDSARNPQQMAKALCARIKQAGDGAYTLDLTNLDEDETACVLWMPPAAWRALGNFADASGGAGLQSVILGAGFVIDETTVSGLAELPALVSLTLQPGPPVDEDLLLQLRRFDTVQVTQLALADEAAPIATEEAQGHNAEPSVHEIAQSARNVLIAALHSHGAKDSINKLPDVLNRLLEEATQIPPSHVDKLLVGFLKNAIESGRGDLVDSYASTILNSPSLGQDPDRRFALLMGLALPIPPADWTPEGGTPASGAFRIANVAAANLADANRVASTYRGPPLLVRMCKGVPNRAPSSPVPQQQVAMYHGTCALFASVLGSRELTSRERRSFCASAFGGNVGGTRTAAQFAMQRGNAGMAAAMLEMVIHADKAPDHKAELFDILGVDLREIRDDLLPLKKLPDEVWVRDMLHWIEPAHDRQIKTGTPWP